MFIHSFIVQNHPHNHSALVQSLSSVIYIYVYLAHMLFCIFVNQCIQVENTGTAQNIKKWVFEKNRPSPIPDDVTNV